MKQVYLDGAANTPMDHRVKKAMTPFLQQKFKGNSEAIHYFGFQAHTKIEEARKEIAERFNILNTHDVMFTSGATESNNWVIKSLALQQLALSENTRKKTILVSNIEHSSIINACESLRPLGFNIIYIKANKHGKITRQALTPLLNDDVFLVCIMAVNNEIGTSNNIKSLSNIIHKYNTVLLCDITQAISYGGSKIFDLTNGPFSGADYYSFSGHKIYGPLGIGCLIKRKDLLLPPLISGGGQEFGLRGGTSNTASIVGLAKAVSCLYNEDWSHKFSELYKYLEKMLYNETLVKITIQPDHYNIVNINCYPHIIMGKNTATLLANENIAVSAGSACDSQLNTALSHVLQAIGVKDEEITSCIRVSFTKYTTKKDIKTLVDALVKLQIEEQKFTKVINTGE